MTPAARLSAAIEILDQVLSGEPATLTLTNWGRRSRYAGSRDRAAVRDIVFDCLRKKRSYAFPFGAQTGRGLVLSHAKKTDADWKSHFTGEGFDPAPVSDPEQTGLDRELEMPDPVRLNYPDFLDAEFRKSLGSNFDAVMSAMLERAPIDLRVNFQKSTRDKAIELLAAEDIGVGAIPGLATGLRVKSNPRRVAQSQAFKRGWIELQDASSQAVARFSGAAPGMSVLDYCAGGGGKSLALYDMIKGEGQVVAHDIAAVRMNDLPARAARAGARITVAQPGHKALRGGGFDLVFVDAPCSGTGSWRRTPDAKWRIQSKDLENLDKTQAEILSSAASYLKPNGKLVYATCSLLARENGERVRKFCEKEKLYSVENEIQYTPARMGDGFYAAMLSIR